VVGEAVSALAWWGVVILYLGVWLAAGGLIAAYVEKHGVIADHPPRKREDAAFFVALAWPVILVALVLLTVAGLLFRIGRKVLP
jgi:hypothetical protein